MTIKSQATEWIREVAERLGDLGEEVAFLGGAVLGLLITDPAETRVRPTKDVDVVVDVRSYGEYVGLTERLRRRGFTEDTEEGAPLCRWVVSNIKVDVMPTSVEVLRFSNRWYGPAFKNAQMFEIGDGVSIRLVTAPYLLATKLEAFRGRGQGDYRSSKDIEDFVAVVDGRSELSAEMAHADSELRHYLHDQVAALLADGEFRQSLSGHLRGDPASQARLPMVQCRLHGLAAQSEEQAVFRTLLDYMIDEHELPRVAEFLCAQEYLRSHRSASEARESIRLVRGRYVLTAKGLVACLPGRAVDEVHRCHRIQDQLREMFLTESERQWSVADLASRIHEGLADTARAVTCLSSLSLFRGITWDRSSGFVAAFILDELVLYKGYLL